MRFLYNFFDRWYRQGFGAFLPLFLQMQQVFDVSLRPFDRRKVKRKD